MIDTIGFLRSVRTISVSEFTAMKRERLPIATVLLFIASLPVTYLLISMTGILDNYVKVNDSSLMFIGLMLSAFPLVVCVAVSIFFAGRVSSEYGSGTIAFNFTMPVSRIEYLIGKFLAYLVPSFIIILSGYGIVGIIAYLRGGAFPISDYLIAIAIALAVTFSLGATSYLIGLIFRKGATLISLLMLYIIFPLILFIIGFASTTETRAIGEPGSLNFLGYLPFNSCLMAVREIIDYGQLLALIPMISSGVPIYTELSPFITIIVSVVWGVIMLIISAILVRRKCI